MRTHILWKNEDAQVVREMWGKISAKEIGKIIQRSPNSVRNVAHRMGLPKIDYETQWKFYWEVTNQRPPHHRDGEIGDHPRNLLASEKRVPIPHEHTLWCEYWNDRRIRKGSPSAPINPDFQIKTEVFLQYLQSCGWNLLTEERRYHLLKNPLFPYQWIAFPHHADPGILMRSMDQAIDLLSDLTEEPAHLIWEKIKKFPDGE